MLNLVTEYHSSEMDVEVGDGRSAVHVFIRHSVGHGVGVVIRWRRAVIGSACHGRGTVGEVRREGGLACHPWYLRMPKRNPA